MIDTRSAIRATISAAAANLLAVFEASLAERAISICSALDASSFCASHLRRLRVERRLGIHHLHRRG